MPAGDLAHYAIVLDAKDNVATALADVPPGRYVLREAGRSREISISEPITAGFKLALTDLAQGEQITKYGYAIGVATAPIEQGQCVHVHNMTGTARTGRGTV